MCAGTLMRNIGNSFKRNNKIHALLENVLTATSPNKTTSPAKLKETYTKLKSLQKRLQAVDFTNEDELTDLQKEINYFTGQNGAVQFDNFLRTRLKTWDSQPLPQNEKQEIIKTKTAVYDILRCFLQQSDSERLVSQILESNFLVDFLATELVSKYDPDYQLDQVSQCNYFVFLF